MQICLGHLQTAAHDGLESCTFTKVTSKSEQLHPNTLVFMNFDGKITEDLLPASPLYVYKAYQQEHSNLSDFCNTWVLPETNTVSSVMKFLHLTIEPLMPAPVPCAPIN